MSSQEKGKGMFSQDCQNTTVSSRLKTSKDIFPWSWPMLLSWVPGCSAYFGSPAMPSWQLLSARTPMLIELFVESGEAGLVSPSLASTQSHPKGIRRCWLTLIFAAHHICWKSSGKINDTDPLLHKAPQTKSPLNACRNFRKGCSLFEASDKRFSMAWRCAPCCLRWSEGEGDGFKKSLRQHSYISVLDGKVSVYM